MSLLEDVILPPDIRANQPAANTVSVGSLYSVTDEGNLIEQSDGATWVTYSGSGSAGSAVVLLSTTVIPHAQILTLPTTPVTLIATPGASSRLQLIQASLSADFSAGAYTNISTTGSIRLQLGANTRSSYIANDATGTPVFTYMSVFLDATDKQATLVPGMQTNVPTLGWGLLTPVVTAVTDMNVAMTLNCTNAAGDFTGGNVANSLTVRVYHTIEAFP